MATRKGLGISVKMILTTTVLILLTVIGFGALNNCSLQDAYDQAATATRITHVPYKGAPLALNDLLGGHIDMMFASPLSLAPPIRQGRLRGLAQMGQRRSHVLPELPTLGELGIQGAEIGGWYGLYAPAKSPQENTDRVLAEVLKALKEPDIRQKIDNLGAEPVGLAPEEFMRFLVADIEKYRKLAQRIHLRIE